ncbi:hypothetical protein IM660_18275 [Ruania alkalisoli]|uniref:DUF2975 domain-containing protein n=1 Tax=Ruania alkalisoli TaxID=2779775 RepID=A0A7M1SSH1_9MICO|nr:hypothetical protein [Ruania alkalisoli]QOR70509.1 hypothetical protein IM660_18275 [Ruania alkalisoli]
MSEQRVPDRGDRVALTVVAVAAAIVAIGSVVMMILLAVEAFTSPNLLLPGFEVENGSSPDFLADAAGVIHSHYTTVTLTVVEPGGVVRLLYFASGYLHQLMVIVVAGAVSWLAWRTVTGRPFVRSATIAVMLAAVAVLAGGAFGDLLRGITRAEVVAGLGENAIATDTSEGFLALMVSSTLGWLGWGLALGVVAQVLWIGERMQKDTEGLV